MDKQKKTILFNKKRIQIKNMKEEKKGDNKIRKRFIVPQNFLCDDNNKTAFLTARVEYNNEKKTWTATICNDFISGFANDIEASYNDIKKLYESEAKKEFNIKPKNVIQSAFSNPFIGDIDFEKKEYDRVEITCSCQKLYNFYFPQPCICNDDMKARNKMCYSCYTTSRRSCYRYCNSQGHSKGQHYYAKPKPDGNGFTFEYK